MEAREAILQVQPAGGIAVHAFTSGAVVQVFLLGGRVSTETKNGSVLSHSFGSQTFQDVARLEEHADIQSPGSDSGAERTGQMLRTGRSDGPLG